MKTSLLIASTLLVGAASVRAADTPADGGPAVVPYRPSVSTPAQLSAPGYLELEAGGLRATAPGGGDPRYTLPWTLKLAFTPDWGIRVGGDAWVHQPGSDGIGDTSVVLKRRFAVDDATAWGLELGEKLPTAGSTRGSGKADTTLNAIFSSDFAPGWHTDLNLNETRLGGTAAAWQTGWAAAFTRSIDAAWGVTGELSGNHRSGDSNSTQLLAAASYSASPGAVFDFGAARGLNGDTPRWQLFAGVTVRLARLF